MIALVDAGNSRIKWAFSCVDCNDSSELNAVRSAFYGRPDERRASLTEILESTWTAYASPTRVLVSNVGGDDVENTLTRWISDNWKIVPEFVCSSKKGWGVTNAYAHPGELGVDRWVGLVAAYKTLNNACCIVDAGTAVTVDALDQRGQHRGGVILPGLALMRRSLLEQTSKIRSAEGTQSFALGQNTGEAVASGTAFALLAGVERAVNEVERVLATLPVVVVTGGDADFIAAGLSRGCRVEQDLVLNGLLFMARSHQ